MLEDKLLIWMFNRGNRDVLRCIYEKYKNDLVTLAAALLVDVSSAEDTVHDVFVSFIKSGDKFRLTGSLRGYLATCVANNARNRNKAAKRRRSVALDEATAVSSDAKRPEFSAKEPAQERSQPHRHIDGWGQARPSARQQPILGKNAGDKGNPDQRPDAIGRKCQQKHCAAECR